MTQRTILSFPHPMTHQGLQLPLPRDLTPTHLLALLLPPTLPPLVLRIHLHPGPWGGGRGDRLRPRLRPRPGPSALQMPVQEMREPERQNEDGAIQPGCSMTCYQPFSTSDLLNRKHNTPSYSEKPQAMVDLMESLFQTQWPTWEDCQQLFCTLVNREERRRVMKEARRYLEEHAPRESLTLLPGLGRPLPKNTQHGTSPRTTDRPTSADTRKPSSGESEQGPRNP